MESGVATMISEVYDALRDAGATEEKARKAAEVLASYDNRFATIERDLTLLKWMVGGLYGLMLPTGWLLLRVASKTGALG